MRYTARRQRQQDEPEAAGPPLSWPQCIDGSGVEGDRAIDCLAGVVEEWQGRKPSRSRIMPYVELSAR